MMRLLQLRAENYRLFHELSLQPRCRLSFVFGANAAGKTSLLEAIYTLSRGKSFRGSAQAELAGSVGRHWRVTGRVATNEDAPTHHLGVQWQDGMTRLRLDGREATSLDLLDALIVQILEPGMHRMLQDGPTYRRSFLDWGVFHVEPSFLPTWRRYRRALRQRNQVLRQTGSDRQLAVWEPELAASGERLTELRRQHIDALGPAVAARLARLFDEGPWQFELQPGWPQGLTLAEALVRGRDQDRRHGATQMGPHRAEVRIRVNDRGIKHRISRGQQKLLIAAMLLAQSEAVAEAAGRYPILLVDDFGAELAERYQTALLKELQHYPGQVIATAFERSGVLRHIDDASMFHVERGVLRALD
ncbi:DNA replication/repair protein RecF [Sinimarinibacterium thermocellulolyticum]|uniref:DNA replication and repair protein RecF n=1 Tax=Sinimarinibacterium thermocellulolyticum TaxID=3170016 RepID=A0ABV2ACL5_9GAMM